MTDIPSVKDLKIVDNLLRYVENLFQARCFISTCEGFINFQLGSGNFGYGFTISKLEVLHYKGTELNGLFKYYHIEWIKQIAQLKKEETNVKIQGKD